MIRPEFGARQVICNKCTFWRGRCTLGHTMQSTYGCPEKKFPPIGTAPYFKSTAKFMGWSEILTQFERDMVAWQKSGFKLADTAEHSNRFSICKKCKPHYKMFRCELCGCIIYIKSKLKVMKCPISLW